jgi:hypothetical protein
MVALFHTQLACAGTPRYSSRDHGSDKRGTRNMRPEQSFKVYVIKTSSILRHYPNIYQKNTRSCRNYRLITASDCKNIKR